MYSWCDIKNIWHMKQLQNRFVLVSMNRVVILLWCAQFNDKTTFISQRHYFIKYKLILLIQLNTNSSITCRSNLYQHYACRFSGDQAAIMLTIFYCKGIFS